MRIEIRAHRYAQLETFVSTKLVYNNLHPIATTQLAANAKVPLERLLWANREESA
jgi:hypothetical protein